MSLNKQSGNMYDFVTHTWNPIKGRCPHNCTYCYMRRIWEMMPNDKLRLDKKDLETSLGDNNFIFVGSSTDMFANEVPDVWIETVLNKCNHYKDNQYLFQSKNPARFKDFISEIPEGSIIGATAETNRIYDNISKAVSSPDRLLYLGNYFGYQFKKMITIEPIMDFDLYPFVNMIKLAKPHFVNIGADSGRNNLPEPSINKIKQLIAELKTFTEVKQKRNLERLMK